MKTVTVGDAFKIALVQSKQRKIEKFEGQIGTDRLIEFERIEIVKLTNGSFKLPGEIRGHWKSTFELPFKTGRYMITPERGLEVYMEVEPEYNLPTYLLMYRDAQYGKLTFSKRGYTHENHDKFINRSKPFEIK